MSVLALLVILRAAEDQILERGALRRDEMKVLLLCLVTGRDHCHGAPENSPRDGHRSDLVHAKTHGKRVAVRRLLGIHKWLVCHPYDRDYHAGGDRFTVRDQLQKPADADCRDQHAARAGSEERPPTDPAATAVFLPKFGKALVGRETVARV